ncbi:MAG: flagellar hook-basal body complex protein, partial [Planctomycetota bacterium]
MDRSARVYHSILYNINGSGLTFIDYASPNKYNLTVNQFFEEKRMGLSQALYTSISGLHGHQTRLDNIGNNLSNANTVGFKKGVHNFADVFSQTINAGKAAGGGYGGLNSLSVGLGTSTGSIASQFTQGSLNQTGSQKDLAIEGNGFFVLETGQGTATQQSYTRDGSFYLGSDGTLRGGEAYRVMGYGAADGVVGTTLGYLNIPIGQVGAASITSKISLGGNINSNVDIAAPNVIAAADTTWTRGNNRALNVGYVETSAGLYDAAAGGFTFLGAAGPHIETIDTDGDGIANWGVIDAGSGTPTNADEVDINMDGVIDAADFMIDTNADTVADAAYKIFGDGVNGLGVDLDNDAVLDANEGTVGTGAAATAATDLKDLQYLSGANTKSPFTGITTGDKITISFRKGGLRKNADFTYGAGAAGDGTTLQDLSIFLTGGLGDDGAVSTDQRLIGGAMGTVRVRERTAVTDGYAAVEEQAGGYLRTYAAGAAGAVDYDGDSVTENTTRLSIASNLGSANDIRDIEISFNNVTFTDMFSADTEHGTPGGGSTSTSFTVYDSTGNPKTVNMQMSLVGLEDDFSTWRWTADSEDDTNATWNFGTFNDSATPTTNVNVGTGLIRFDKVGNVVDQSELSETSGIVLDQGANPQISVDIVQGASDQDLDFSMLTQVAAASDLNLKSQDGNPQGTLDSFNVAVDGTINGVYTNGVVEALGRVALAMVPDEQGMIHVGGNLFIESAASGTPVIDSP